MTENIQASLEKTRKDIDDIDEQLCSLISRRVACSIRIGEIKKTSSSIQTYQPEREKTITDRLEQKCPAVPATYIRRVWAELFSLSRAEQNFLPVAVPCKPGQALHLAARLALGRSTRCLPCETVEAMVAKLESGECGLGILPANVALPSGCVTLGLYDSCDDAKLTEPANKGTGVIRLIGLDLPAER